MPKLWRRTALLLAVIGTAGTSSALAAGSTASAHRGPLSGEWVGYIGSANARRAMDITINARETAGSWKISASCYGTLTLDSISDGYHHFRRHTASGASCAGGDVDCLKRYGSELYDAVTSHLGGAWDTSGTFKRGS